MAKTQKQLKPRKSDEIISSGGRGKYDEIKPVRKPRKTPGRPRKGKRLTVKLANAIANCLSKGMTAKTIVWKYRRYGVSIYQVSRVKTGKVKLNVESRADSHKSTRGFETLPRGARTTNQLLDDQLRTALEDLEIRGLAAEERIDALRNASLVDRHVTSQRLIAKLSRRDAEVVIELIRLFQPDATDEECVQFYKQAEMQCKLKGEQ